MDSDISKDFSYEKMDHPLINTQLFHPRGDYARDDYSHIIRLKIPVADNVSVGAKFHIAAKDAPIIIFFHGNGEIVSDYDDLGPIYTNLGINFFPVDYRGYGDSTGSPTPSNMMKDAITIFEYCLSYLEENEYRGPVLIMGRSLGSASAIEIALKYQSKISALIIESGFAFTLPLLNLIGVDPEQIGLEETECFNNFIKIGHYNKPLLIIHAENDHIIPISEGEVLYNNCAAHDKEMLRIKNADHNSIFGVGMKAYLESIKGLQSKIIQ